MTLSRNSWNGSDFKLISQSAIISNMDSIFSKLQYSICEYTLVQYLQDSQIKKIFFVDLKCIQFNAPLCTDALLKSRLSKFFHTFRIIYVRLRYMVTLRYVQLSIVQEVFVVIQIFLFKYWWTWLLENKLNNLFQEENECVMYSTVWNVCYFKSPKCVPRIKLPVKPQRPFYCRSEANSPDPQISPVSESRAGQLSA